jgi:glucose/arabinose dehydrogenase
MKVHLTINAVFLVVVLIISPSAMDSIFDKVFALQIASSSSSPSQPPLPSQIGLVAINFGNPPPPINHFKLPPGYRIEPVIWNLTLPSSITFDDNNNMYVAEAGFAYGGLVSTPRILKVDNQSKSISVLVDRNLNGPITDIEFYHGKLYVSHRAIISTVEPKTGLVKDIIVGLPSMGDHHNNQIAIGGPDKRIYFGEGEVTNSGVVGEDNFKLGWPKMAPTVHDIPPKKNITLAGQNFVTKNPLTSEPNNDTTTTGAFVQFGTPTYAGQVIPGDVKCNGCILSANLDGTDIKMVGWGFRSAYGMAFSPIGNNNNTKLLVTANGADERGSRPIANDTEKVYNIDISNSSQLGKFYGWPDFFGNAQPVTDPIFQSPRGEGKPLEFLMQNHPHVEKPSVELGVGAALAQVDFSPRSASSNKNTDKFGLEGMAFIAEFGIMVPISHLPGSYLKNQEREKIVGQKVVMLNIQTKNYSDFVSLNTPDNSFRPVGIAFNQNEDSLYIASIGKVEVRTTLPNNNNNSSIHLPEPVPWYYPNTGVIWKVIKTPS